MQELIKHDNAKIVIYDVLSDISDSKGIISKYKELSTEDVIRMDKKEST